LVCCDLVRNGFEGTPLVPAAAAVVVLLCIIYKQNKTNNQGKIKTFTVIALFYAFLLSKLKI